MVHLDTAVTPTRRWQPKDSTKRTWEDVKLVRWPFEAARRDQYRREGVPCLLVVEAGAKPPVCTDPCEDWVRAPISKVDSTTASARSSLGPNCRSCSPSYCPAFPRCVPDHELDWKSGMVVRGVRSYPVTW